MNFAILHARKATLILGLVAASFVGAIVEVVDSRGYHMDRTQFPQKLANLLRGPNVRVGRRIYPQAVVEPIAVRSYPLTHHQVFDQMRRTQASRNLILLGGPFPDRGQVRGFSAALPVSTEYDRPNHKTFAFVSVVRGQNGPRVHFNGLATVKNAPSLERDVLAQHAPVGTAGPGSVLTAQEMFYFIQREH